MSKERQPRPVREALRQLWSELKRGVRELAPGYSGPELRDYPTRRQP